MKDMVSIKKMLPLPPPGPGFGVDASGPSVFRARAGASDEGVFFAGNAPSLSVANDREPGTDLELRIASLQLRPINNERRSVTGAPVKSSEPAYDIGFSAFRPAGH
jgi:hypothetical protein